MSWVLTFITALVLIFAVPVVNNFDEVQIIVEDIKNAIEQELSSNELFLQLKDSFTFTTMDEETLSDIPAVVFDINHQGDIEDEVQAYLDADTSLTTKQRQKQEKLLLDVRERFLESISPEKMLELSAEVYNTTTFTLISKTYSVKKGDVEGWRLVCRYPKDKEATDSGTSIALWMNELDNETYCISMAGTDSLDEVFTQYIPMETNPDYATQQQEIASFVKNIRTHMQESSIYDECGKIRKLFTTGHSMGAFFSMWLGTDLYDSNLHTLAKRTHLGGYLSKKNIRAYTFAAPGLLTEIPSQLSSKIRDFLKVGSEIPSWSKFKINQDKEGVYDSMLFQYTNERDLVPNLNKITSYNILPSSWSKDWIKFNFIHLGNHYDFAPEKLTLAESFDAIKRFNIFENAIPTIMKAGALMIGMDYHMPHHYLLGFKNSMYKLV